MIDYATLNGHRSYCCCVTCIAVVRASCWREAFQLIECGLNDSAARWLAMASYWSMWLADGCVEEV